MQKVVAYLRVSTDKQDVENQRFGIIEYAKRNNLELNDDSFFEDVVSGKKSWRDREIGRILKKAKDGDILLVAEISRLARSTLQVLEILQYSVEHGITVHIVKNNMIMDGSLHSRITATVLGLAAEIEREFISARTTEALAKRKAEGLPLGRPKGSKNRSKKLDQHSEIIKDLLKKGVQKSAIATIVDCTVDTLYEWMRANGLERYIGVSPMLKIRPKITEKRTPPVKEQHAKLPKSPNAGNKNTSQQIRESKELAITQELEDDEFQELQKKNNLIDELFRFLVPKKRHPGEKHVRKKRGKK